MKEKANIVELTFEFGEKYLFTRCENSKWKCEHWERKDMWDCEDYDHEFAEIISLSKNAIGIRVA